MSVAYDRSSIAEQTAWGELLDGLKGKLSAEKYNAIAKYFTFPLSVVNMSNDMILDLFKVFDSRNSVFSVDYQNDRAKATGDAMLSDLNVRGWIENVGKEVLKCAPNTWVVLDKDDKGEILLLNVPNEKQLGYKFNKDGSFDYVIFEHSNGKDEHGTEWEKIGVYDSLTYWVIQKVKGIYSIFSENTHTLGSCPAKFFFNKPLINEHEYNRCVPFSSVLGTMEQWTIFDLFQYYQKHFASFQVIQYHDNGCVNNDCNNGSIYVDPVINEEGVRTSDGYDRDCPTCAKNALIAPGSAIGIEISTSPDEQDARNLFGFVSPDMEPLKYIDDSQKAIESNIKENTVGYSDAITSDAINETQVKALVESRKKPLLDIKPYLEETHKWIVEGSLKLENDIDAKSNANYGTEWFIMSVDDLLNIITKAKAAGGQATYIEQLNRQVIETEYKGNPALSQRMLIAADLEPNAFDTQLESRAKFAEGMMSREDYYIKSNFTDLLAQFERDNGSIVLFGKELPYSTKIDRIKVTLLHYTNQKISKEDEQDDNAESMGASDSGTSQF